METTHIEATRMTPMVFFDPRLGVIEFKGVSSTDNPTGFYHGILGKLDTYMHIENEGITVNLSFVYLNTSSSKCLFDIFKRLILVRNSGKHLTINWFYQENDEDMKEVGEDYSRVFDLPFNFISLAF